MKSFLVKLDLNLARWTNRDVAIFGPKNVGVVVHAENIDDVPRVFNPDRLAGNQISTIYMRITELTA